MFWSLRDNLPPFAEIKAQGRIGIPVFEPENGGLLPDERRLQPGGCADC